MKNKKILFSVVFLLLFLLFFFKSFGMHFFEDDFFFLSITKQFDLAHFFSIQRTTFYRPLSTEVFYFLVQHLPFPLLTGKILMFAVFLMGILFLYKTVLLITKNKILSSLTVILYSFHFSHVFQLYWFATFQEVLQFSLLSLSLYLLLKNRWGISLLCFIGALFSKEQTVLFPLFAFFLYYKQYKRIPLKALYFIALSGLFGLISFYVNTHSPQVAEYAIQLKPKLMVNNYLWYFLWSLGFPSMLPDYMRSIFSIPIPKFWTFFEAKEFGIYFFNQLLFLVLFIGACAAVFFSSAKKEKEKIGRILLFVLVSFGLFLLPVLPIIHKWMVRLTIPLVFVSFFEAYIFAHLWKEKKLKWTVGVFIGLYLLWNFFGVKIHEQSSTYIQETQIVQNADKLFSDKKYQDCNFLYFKDPKDMGMSEWEGSKKLGLTFAGQSFLPFYFPNKKIEAVYEYQTKAIPRGACVIKGELLLK